jgi:Chaperone of endosialidase
MNPMLQCKPTILPLFIAGVLACFGLLPKALAVVPPPDGGYPGFNTAEGQNALFSLTTGAANTAVGWFSLFSNTDGSFNTATGAGALLFNTARENTAFGAAALLFNSTGVANTAVGAAALLNNTEGGFNTSIGEFALSHNTTGSNNTANGFQALFSNTSGDRNTATGWQALVNNTGANNNTAHGFEALHNSNSGNNTGIGFDALEANTTGNSNTAVGANALRNATGSDNIALGEGAGVAVLAGNNNIEIGNGGANADDNTIRIGLEGTQTQTFIAGILGNGPFGCDVTIDPVTGQLGVGACISSERFKKDIGSMNKASEAIFSLKPVTFHYKNDKTNIPQFGLIAEEVAKVNPALIAVDKEGKPYSVRYQQIDAMLLNEFLKEHRTVQEQGATITQLKSMVEKQEAANAQQQKQIEALATGLQKVSAQLEASRSAPQVVNNP